MDVVNIEYVEIVLVILAAAFYSPTDSCRVIETRVWCGGVRGIDVADPSFPVLARRVCCSGPCHAVKSSGCNGHSADLAWGASTAQSVTVRNWLNYKHVLAKKEKKKEKEKKKIYIYI